MEETNISTDPITTQPSSTHTEWAIPAPSKKATERVALPAAPIGKYWPSAPQARGRKWGLMRDGITAFEFHLALSSVSRPWPARALELAPDIEEVLTKVIIRGMRP